MSFWSETHPSYDKYQILWDKYVPGIGECSNTTAEAFRLVSGVYYQLHNNGSWFGTTNYHAKLYAKQRLCSPADYFMYNLKREYDSLKRDYDSDYSDEDTATDEWKQLEEKCKTMDNLMGEVVEWAWDELADESDKKNFRSSEKKKEAKKKAEIREKKKKERKSNKLMKEETDKLKAAYKIATGKRFRRKKGSTNTPLETLREIEVMYKGSMTLLRDIPLESGFVPLSLKMNSNNSL
jgi:hypothetical protein